jgi:hypothetical protein
MMSKFEVGDRIRVYIVDGVDNTGVVLSASDDCLRYRRDKCGNPFTAHPKQCRRLVRQKEKEYCVCLSPKYYNDSDERRCANCNKLFMIYWFGIKQEALEKRVKALEMFKAHMTCESCYGIVKHEQIYKRCECF